MINELLFDEIKEMAVNGYTSEEVLDEKGDPLTREAVRAVFMCKSWVKFQEKFPQHVDDSSVLGKIQEEEEAEPTTIRETMDKRKQMVVFEEKEDEELKISKEALRIANIGLLQINKLLQERRTRLEKEIIFCDQYLVNLIEQIESLEV